MKKILNPQFTLLAVGVLQPTLSTEVRGFLSKIFSDGGDLPSVSDYEEFLSYQEDLGRVRSFEYERIRLYSLTYDGGKYLPAYIRHIRDKFRLFLLRDAYKLRVRTSYRDDNVEFDGASPSEDARIVVKGSAANKPGRRFAPGQVYWPRISKQFARTGTAASRYDIFPKYLSFESLGDLATACGSSEDTFNFDYVGLGTAVGISPKLISQIVHNSDRHYRRFLIPKKSGGVRSIDSPRIFLKVLQWFIMDYLLPDIPIHGSVTSFVPGKSVVTNAMPHCRKAYVGSIDIEQFFPSLTIELVSKLFIENGYNEIEAFVLSKLVTKRGCLPQGAPTSPTLSNALLYRFDEQMTDYCAVGGMSYSRYADDITISGNAGARIQAALLHAKRTLHAHYNLRINEKKTRIRSQGSQQRVTGVVVNEEPAPPRVYRRKIRAIFHGALNQPHEYVGRLDELAGYVGHLDMFPKISGSKDIREYKAVLEKLRAIQNLQ